MVGAASRVLRGDGLVQHLVGHQESGARLTLAVGVVLLPLYLGFYAWELVMRSTSAAFEEMLEAAYEDDPPRQ